MDWDQEKVAADIRAKALDVKAFTDSLLEFIPPQWLTVISMDIQKSFMALIQLSKKEDSL